MNTQERTRRVQDLRRSRPRSRYVRWTTAAALLLVVLSWAFGGFRVGDTFSERRMHNLDRFIGEATPAPLKDDDPTTTLSGWIWEIFRQDGLEASLNTLAISVAAIVLAGILGALGSLPAARTLATPEPYLPEGAPVPRVRRLVWSLVVGVSRAVLIFLRAVPEYLWAFLFIALLGPHAWPAILALALHNAGILGRLGAETVENVEPAVPRALRGMGAGRLEIATWGVLPTIFNRWLLYFFYRWETCVREATVLGLLGFSTLGWYFIDTRTRMRYDEMLLFMVFGGVLVIAGDLISTWIRGRLRRAS